MISVSLPEGTVRALRSRVGPRGVSALVASAIEQHLRNRATADYLTEYEQRGDAFTADEIDEAEDIWRRAEAAEKAWHADAG